MKGFTTLHECFIIVCRASHWYCSSYEISFKCTCMQCAVPENIHAPLETLVFLHIFLLNILAFTSPLLLGISNNPSRAWIIFGTAQEQIRLIYM